MGGFAHSYGPTRHTRGPAAGLSHNHAAPKAGTNDRGVTTFSPPTAVRLKDSVSKRGEDQSRVPFSTLRGLCLWCNHLPPRQFCLWFYLFPLSFSPDSTNGGRSDDRNRPCDDAGDGRPRRLPSTMSMCRAPMREPGAPDGHGATAHGGTARPESEQRRRAGRAAR